MESAGGRAHCALCGEAIRPQEDALVTPDFLADESDPLWRFADAPMHRACFLVWTGAGPSSTGTTGSPGGWSRRTARIRG